MNNKFLNSATIMTIPETESFWDNLPEGGNILELIPENDSRLSQKSIPYDFAKYTQEETNQLVLDMGATMRYNRGIGLSAVQFGRLENVFVIEIGADLPLAMFNPRIVDTGVEIAGEEGCLSYPGLVLDIKRPSFVKVRFQNFNNETITERFEGLSARVICHEYDHLQGIVMRDHVSRLRYEKVLKARKKRNR